MQKLSNVDLGYYLDGNFLGRLGAVNLAPFVGVDLNLWPTVHIAVIMLTPGDVK